MDLDDFSRAMLPRVEDELHRLAGLYRQSWSGQPASEAGFPDLYEMISYHMGWSGGPMSPASRGKRVRPLLVLLTCHAAGGDWESALPSACSIEMVHNFSLIHDDIQDESPLRHNRETIWKKWGPAQAINAGDLLFTLAMAALTRPDQALPPGTALRALDTITSACMQLTRGQTLDLAYENCDHLQEEDYWPMVNGKTAALIAACTSLGGILAGSDEERLIHLDDFGRKLGLAFQVKDDLLGIWGADTETGKSSESDIASRKKSLPILYALGKEGSFSQRWFAGPFTSDEVPELAAMLDEAGARTYTIQVCSRLTAEAMHALRLALPANEGRHALHDLADRLLARDS